MWLTPNEAVLTQNLYCNPAAGVLPASAGAAAQRRPRCVCVCVCGCGCQCQQHGTAAKHGGENSTTIPVSRTRADCIDPLSGHVRRKHVATAAASSTSLTAANSGPACSRHIENMIFIFCLNRRPQMELSSTSSWQQQPTATCLATSSSGR